MKKVKNLFMLGLCGLVLAGIAPNVQAQEDTTIKTPSEYVVHNGSKIKEELAVEGNLEGEDRNAALKQLKDNSVAIKELNQGSYQLTYQTGVQIGEIVALTGYSNVGQFVGNGTEDANTKYNYTYEIKTSSETRGQASHSISNVTTSGIGTSENVYTLLKDTATTLPIEYVALLEGKYYQEPRGDEETSPELPVGIIKDFTSISGIVAKIAEQEGTVARKGDNGIVVNIPVVKFVESVEGGTPLEEVLLILSAIPDAKEFVYGVDGDSVSIQVRNENGGVVSHLYLEAVSGEVSVEEPAADNIVTKEQFGTLVNEYEKLINQETPQESVQEDAAE